MSSKRKPDAMARLRESVRPFLWDERCGPQRMTAFDRRVRALLEERAEAAINAPMMLWLTTKERNVIYRAVTNHVPPPEDRP